MSNLVLSELARVKALFQARAIAAVLDIPPPTIKQSLTVGKSIDTALHQGE
jgi:hypothetical protein